MALALPDAPRPKRRRITAKSSDAGTAYQRHEEPRRLVQHGPTVIVERSRSSPLLSIITVTNFGENMLGLAPLALLAGNLKDSLSTAINGRISFKVKAEIEWMIRVAVTQKERKENRWLMHTHKYDSFWMNIVPFKIDASSTLAGGGAPQVAEMLRIIRQSAQDRMNFIKSRDSNIEFVRITTIKLSMLPGYRDLCVSRAMPNFPETDDLSETVGCSVKLPQSLLAKSAV